jgi:hypothetical protein
MPIVEAIEAMSIQQIQQVPVRELAQRYLSSEYLETYATPEALERIRKAHEAREIPPILFVSTPYGEILRDGFHRLATAFVAGIAFLPACLERFEE